MFAAQRETVDHGTLNAWERGPYFSDLGYVEDPSSNLKPTVEELAAGATPGFKRVTAAGGSAVGLYTRLANNFLLGKTHDYCWHLGCILLKVSARSLLTGGALLHAGAEARG